MMLQCAPSPTITKPPRVRAPRPQRDEPSTGLLDRIAAGDSEALNECTETYGAAIWGMARRRLPDVHDAEEAVQDVLASVWQHAGRFDSSQGSEKTFVMTLARRRIIDRSRRRRPRPAEFGEEPASSCTAARQVETRDELGAVTHALSILKPVERRVLTLAVHEGMSHSQVARTTGLPLGTVKTHLRRGLQRVRGLLGA